MRSYSGNIALPILSVFFNLLFVEAFIATIENESFWLSFQRLNGVRFTLISKVPRNIRKCTENLTIISLEEGNCRGLEGASCIENQRSPSRFRGSIKLPVACCIYQAWNVRCQLCDNICAWYNNTVLKHGLFDYVSLHYLLRHGPLYKVNFENWFLILWLKFAFFVVKNFAHLYPQLS